MEAREAMRRIRQCGIVPALRTPSASQARRAVDALAAGGVTVMEIPVTVPGVYELIAEVRARPGGAVLIGAGTVLDVDAARRAIQAGAQFIVCPSLHLEVLDFCRRERIAVIPGALTPTEIATAWRAGADCVKVFPIGSLGGVSYLKALRAVFPDAPLMPMGGVNLDDAAGYVREGAPAVGVGGDLIDLTALAAGRDEILTQRAAEYLRRIQTALEEVRAKLEPAGA